MGKILGQWVDKKPIVICYASKTLAEAQMHSTMMDKEVLVVVYATEVLALHLGD